MGMAIMLFWGRQVVQGLRSRSWPTAPGVVVTSGVEEVKLAEHGTRYEPEVTYRYTVDGRTYTGRRWRFGATAAFNRTQAGRLVARYPVGEAIAVRYDPFRPATSVLEPGVGDKAVFAIALGLGAVCVVAGVASIVLDLD